MNHSSIKIRPRHLRTVRIMRVAILTILAIGPATRDSGRLVCAHDQIPGRPQVRPIVIQNATVHPIDGDVLSKGSVLFDGGKIVSVAKKVAAPDNAIIIDGADKHVYPGLIEPMSDIALREINAVDATDDRIEFGDLNPNAKAWVAVNPDSELIPVARSGGVMLAMTAPSGKWMRGQTAVIQLDGWSAKEMVLTAPAGLYVNWSEMEPSGDDAKKRAEQRAKRFERLDALIEEAAAYKALRDAPGNTTPSDLRLTSLVQLIDGRLPLIVQANRQHEIESAVAYSAKHQLKLIVYGGYDAEACADLLKKHSVSVIIAGIHRLPMRRHEPYDRPFTLPARLDAAGVTFCIGGAGGGSPNGAAATRNLPYHAATAAAFGLKPEDAVRAITLNAAKVLGIDERVGSLTRGKDATLIISDGDILESDTHVTHAWIQGRQVDLGNRHKTLFKKYQQKYRR